MQDNKDNPISHREESKVGGYFNDENLDKEGSLDRKGNRSEKQLSQGTNYVTPHHHSLQNSSDSDNFKSFNDSTMNVLRVLGSPKPNQPPNEKEDHFQRMCKSHLNNNLSYICIKDKCGDMLCPLCLYEHQKYRHVGNYIPINEFYDKAGTNFIEANETLLNSLSRIVNIESLMEKKEKFDLSVAEQLQRTEENIIEQIKLFFNMVRKELSSDVFIDYHETVEMISQLHLKTNTAIQNLITEWGIKDNKKTTNFDYTPEESKKILKRDYTELTNSLEQTIVSVEKKVNECMNSIKKNSRIEVELSPVFQSKLNLLLNESLKIRRMGSAVKPSGHTQMAGLRETNEDIILYYKELLQSPDVKRSPEVKKSSQINQDPDLKAQNNFHNNLDVIEEQSESPGRVSLREESIKKLRSKTVSPLRGSSDYLKSQRISHTSIMKELNKPELNYILDYFVQNYNNHRIKIFGHEFFEKLSGCEGPLPDTNFKISSLNPERVNDILNIKSNKHKTIFSAYEKIFLLLNLKESAWALIEIKTNPKTIIIYDFLGKMVKTQFYENIFEGIFQVIRFEYKTKLNQSADNFMWERKVSFKPTLVVKNDGDSGIVALKLIANSFFNKEFSGNRISANEVSLIRKKLERILRTSSETQRASGKTIIV